PTNRKARVARQQALQLREQQFELNLPVLDADPGAGTAEWTAPEGGGADETRVRPPAPETQPQIEVPEEEQAEEGAEKPAEEEAETPAQRADRLDRQRQDYERAVEIRKQFEEARRKQDEAKKAKAKKQTWRKKKPTDEEVEDARERLRAAVRWALATA